MSHCNSLILDATPNTYSGAYFVSCNAQHEEGAIDYPDPLIYATIYNLIELKYFTCFHLQAFILRMMKIKIPETGKKITFLSQLVLIW